GQERTVQYEGVVDEPTGPDLDELKPQYFARFPAARDGREWPAILYLRAKPRWLRFSDFRQTPAEIVELTFNEAAEQAGATPAWLTARLTSPPPRTHNNKRTHR